MRCGRCRTTWFAATSSRGISVSRSSSGAASIAQAAYVGSRQVKIKQRFDLNAGQVLGAGAAGPALLHQIRPYDGHRTADAGRAQQVRFAAGYVCSGAWPRVSRSILRTRFRRRIGICCDDLSDGFPRSRFRSTFKLNRAVMPTTARTISPRRSSPNCRLAEGSSGRPAASAAKAAGRLAVERPDCRILGTPFTVSAPGTSLNAARATPSAPTW